MRNIIIINHDISSLKKRYLAVACCSFCKKKETQLSEWDMFLPQKFHKAKKKLGSSFRDKRAILKSPSVYSLNVKTSHQFHVQVQI